LRLISIKDSLEPWQDTLNELGARVQEVEKKIALLKATVAKEMQVVELAKVLLLSIRFLYAFYVQTFPLFHSLPSLPFL
jgi:hypothetical protein